MLTVKRGANTSSRFLDFIIENDRCECVASLRELDRDKRTCGDDVQQYWTTPDLHNGLDCRAHTMSFGERCETQAVLIRPLWYDHYVELFSPDVVNVIVRFCATRIKPASRIRWSAAKHRLRSSIKCSKNSAKMEWTNSITIQKDIVQNLLSLCRLLCPDIPRWE